jgi:hypothetical protein
VHLLLPGLLAALVWVPFVVALRHGRRLAAAGVVAAWSVALAAGLPALERWSPGVCARSFVGAGEYAAQMAVWARAGVGCESDPACFVPQHLLHAVAFVVGSVATAGLAGLAFAAVLFGWMGAYAAALATASGAPVAAAALAWHPWAVVRVAAYLSLGVALAEPLARHGLPALPGRGRWVAFGVTGLVADIALKALFAAFWQRAVLLPLLGLD